MQWANSTQLIFYGNKDLNWGWMDGKFRQVARLGSNVEDRFSVTIDGAKNTSNSGIFNNFTLPNCNNNLLWLLPKILPRKKGGSSQCNDSLNL